MIAAWLLKMAACVAEMRRGQPWSDGTYFDDGFGWTD